MKFLVRSDNNESVEVDILGKSHEDGLGGYWLAIHTTITLNGYHASVGGINMVTSELERFRSQVIQMYENVSGTAELTSLEGLIYLQAELDRTGHVLWKGQTRYPIGIGNELRFHFDNDQSYLPELISQLNEITKALSA